MAEVEAPVNKYVEGRRYIGGQGHYYLPNDIPETERLSKCHSKQLLLIPHPCDTE